MARENTRVHRCNADRLLNPVCYKALCTSFHHMAKIGGYMLLAPPGALEVMMMMMVEMIIMMVMMIILMKLMKKMTKII